MNELQALRQSQPFQALSLSKFASFADVPYWKLGDHHKSRGERESKNVNRADLERLVKDVALKHPTFGYRRLFVELRQEGHQVSVHGVRKMLHKLRLNPAPVRKPRRVVPGVVPVHEWPTGRRVQIDATRLSLDDGIVWIYIVLDVLSRAVLAIRAVRAVSMHSAKMTLLEGINELRAQGIAESVVVQSDAGSDFTSEVFQTACLSFGCWVRSKVSQKGGMGILERCNRTFKYDFAFRTEWKTLAEAVTGVQEFREWYNTKRVHSALEYALPWNVLVASGKALKAA